MAGSETAGCLLFVIIQKSYDVFIEHSSSCKPFLFGNSTNWYCACNGRYVTRDILIVCGLRIHFFSESTFIGSRFETVYDPSSYYQT